MILSLVIILASSLGEYYRIFYRIYSRIKQKRTKLSALEVKDTRIIRTGIYPKMLI